ncbi:substrate-binding domain-containing protein [Paraburkholderia flava]|uniref:substrate-binding domain-containing protein n=1 Tax=Paraburkholderia flava TaxID=2547393 RepID=UPI00105ED19F|nr:substrate-binding domain-containing protein [Paraburkholderia flava]
MKFSKRKICTAVVFACSALGASAAMAQVSLLGGGSSLVFPSITSEITQFGGGINYFSVGSGAGQTAFLTNAPASLGQTSGTVHFANSDAALSSTQVDTTGSYARTSTDGKLIQLPYIVTPITVPYVSQPSSVTGTVALDDNDLCGIYSGKITNWTQIINPTTSAAYTTVSTPIQVVYRLDGSGTTDLLTRHLAAVCTTGASGNSNVAFNETQAFASNFTTVPANFIGATGSGGVASQLVSYRTAGTAAFGYLSPDYTNTTLAPSSPNATNALAVASLRNSTTGLDVAPTYQNATIALGSVAAPSGAAAEANPFNWVPGANISKTDPSWIAISNPKAGYPISGTSNIIVSQCYKTSLLRTRLVNFLTAHYTNATYAAILNNNGFDVVPASYKNAITADILANTNGYNLNIGNSVCGTLGR